MKQKQITIIFAVAIFFLAHGFAWADYSLAPGPYSLENLGSLVQSNTQEHQLMQKLSNGETHLFMHYVHPTESWKYKTKLLDVNLDQKTWRVLDEALSRPGPVIYYSNDNVYFTTGDPQSHLVEYKPLTGEIREVGIMAEKSPGPGGAIGGEGALFFGSCCKGKATRYDPVTETITDFGRMDEASADNYQYAYTIGADNRYVYVGLGQSPWYLSVLDRETNQKTVYWKDEIDTGGTVSRGTDGKLYYYRYNSKYSPGNKYYLLENGVPTEITAAQYPAQISNYYGNVARDITKFSSQFGFEVDLADAYPDNFNSGTATIRFRKVGEETWDSIEATGFTLGPVTIKMIASLGNGKLLGAADFYGPVFNFDTFSKATTGLGRPQWSIYDIMKYDSENVYFAGYAAASLRYNPQNPWTLSASTPDKTLQSVNPYKMPTGYGKYHFYLEKGSDGLVYTGAHHERDSTGGELGWYDPVTNKSLGSLRTPFVEYDVADLEAVSGGSKIVYSATGINSSDDAKLFVFDVATKQITKSITVAPAAQSTSAGKIVEVEPGIVLGLIKSVDPTLTQIYKVNIDTGQIYYNVTYPERAFANRSYSNDRIVKGPDGYVWLQIANNICRINPVDGTVEKILIGQAGNPMFVENDLYIYGNTELKVIKNLFKKIFPMPILIKTQKSTQVTSKY